MGALLVYDITRRNTFENLDKWLKELKNFAEEGIVTILIGNKSDLRQFRSVKTEQGEEYASKNNMIFLETSALDATNIEEAFNIAVQ
jgi:small GTP-binding protein